MKQETRVSPSVTLILWFAVWFGLEIPNLAEHSYTCSTFSGVLAGAPLPAGLNPAESMFFLKKEGKNSFHSSQQNHSLLSIPQVSSLFCTPFFYGICEEGKIDYLFNVSQ